MHPAVVILALVGVCSSYGESQTVHVIGPRVGVGARIGRYGRASGHRQEVDVVDAGGIVVDELDRRARCYGEGRWVEVQG